jgi:hypothetical protein
MGFSGGFVGLSDCTVHSMHRTGWIKILLTEVLLDRYKEAYAF